MILTAIVITMGIAAFVLALTYRSYRLTTDGGSRQRPRGHPGVAAVGRGAPRSTRTVRDPDRLPATPTQPDELDALPGHEGSR